MKYQISNFKSEISNVGDFVGCDIIRTVIDEPNIVTNFAALKVAASFVVLDRLEKKAAEMDAQ